MRGLRSEMRTLGVPWRCHEGVIGASGVSWGGLGGVRGALRVSWGWGLSVSLECLGIVSWGSLRMPWKCHGIVMRVLSVFFEGLGGVMEGPLRYWGS